MTEAYLSLGSNIGDRLTNLSRAVSLLDRPEEGIHVLSVSPVYETDPVGYKDQDDFLNIVVRIETSLEPLALLSVCQRIENASKGAKNWKAEERERTARVLRGESADGKCYLRDDELTPEELEAKYG